MDRNVTWNCRICVGVAFLCLLCAFLPILSTLELIDQQHFAKTKMVYMSLPSEIECHIRYKKLLLSNSANDDIAWCSCRRANVENNRWDFKSRKRRWRISHEKPRLQRIRRRTWSIDSRIGSRITRNQSTLKETGSDPQSMNPHTEETMTYV